MKMAPPAMRRITIGHDDNVARFNRMHFQEWSYDYLFSPDLETEQLLYSNRRDVSTSTYEALVHLRSELAESHVGVTITGTLAENSWFLPSSKISGGYYANVFGGGLKIELDKSSELMVGADSDRSVILKNVFISIILPDQLQHLNESMERICAAVRVQRVMISFNDGHFLVIEI